MSNAFALLLTNNMQAAIIATNRIKVLSRAPHAPHLANATSQGTMTFRFGRGSAKESVYPFFWSDLDDFRDELFRLLLQISVRHPCVVYTASQSIKPVNPGRYNFCQARGVVFVGVAGPVLEEKAVSRKII